MLEIRPLRCREEIQDVCDQIDEQFGEQYHPSLDVLQVLIKSCPDQIIGAFEDGRLIGHSFVLPLSESGREFFFHPDLPESQMDLSHLVLKPDPTQKIHFFVYSIVSHKKSISVLMIKKLIDALKSMVPHSHPESTFFAEVVSQDGKNLAGKLGLEFFHSYLFEGSEELFIYQNTALNSIKAFSKYDRLFETNASRANLRK